MADGSGEVNAPERLQARYIRASIRSCAATIRCSLDMSAGVMRIMQSAQSLASPSS
jgi:hypothetical protein